MIIRKLPLVFLIFSSMITWSQSICNLTVKLTGLDNEKGKLFVAVYNTKESFLKTPYKGEILEINNGSAIAEFKDLPQGVYAVSSFHDKNNNGKLDTNFMGIPKEPHATSNNAAANFGPPKFEDAKFKLEKKETVITIQY